MRYYDLVKKYYKSGGEAAALNSAKSVDELLEMVKEVDMTAYWHFIREQQEAWGGAHFDEDFAKWQVEQMHHKGSDGKMYTGEHWSMEDTNAVFAKYRSKIPSLYNEYDFYVALNATYHDLCVWARQNFGDDYEQKIIEMAIYFWFLDEDYHGDGKVWEYFAKQ